MEERLLALCPDWRQQWLPLVEADHPQPDRHRPLAWTTLQKLRSLTRLLSRTVSTSLASLLQFARLSSEATA
ncbi:MAG: hypothetical protein KC910_05855 [Candidatus Eremiobacteraeota bacterium]|nr:hypothetical protein [Candidatus Eremiobacteraeota bacterium]